MLGSMEISETSIFTLVRRRRLSSLSNQPECECHCFGRDAASCATNVEFLRRSLLTSKSFQVPDQRNLSQYSSLTAAIDTVLKNSLKTGRTYLSTPPTKGCHRT